MVGGNQSNLLSLLSMLSFLKSVDWLRTLIYLFLLFFSFLNIFYWLCSCLIFFTPFIPLCPASPTRIPPPPCFSSCPWVIHKSSLDSLFPIPFLPSPCLLSTYHLCYLFSVTFPSLSPSQSPIDNPPCDLHFCGSVSVLVVGLVFLCLVLGVVVYNCEFAVIFTVHIFYLLFLR